MLALNVMNNDLFTKETSADKVIMQYNPWSSEDDKMILKYHNVLGNKWDKVNSLFLNQK